MAQTPSLRLFLLLAFLLKVTPSKGISYKDDVYSALEKQFNSFNKRVEDLEFTVKKQEKVIHFQLQRIMVLGKTVRSQAKEITKERQRIKRQQGST